MALEGGNDNMDRRSFLKGAASLGATAALGGAALEVGAHAFGLDEAEAAEMDETKKQADAFLRFSFARSQKIRDKFNEIGNKKGDDTARTQIPSEQLPEALKQYPALQELGIHKAEILIEKKGENLSLTLIMHDKQDKEYTVKISGKREIR